MVFVAQREGEDRPQPLVEGARRESREPVVGPQVRNDDRLALLVRNQTRTLAELGLQLLESHGGLVRGGNVVRIGTGRDQRDPGCADGQDVDDPNDQMIKDRLDREVRDERPRELTEDV